MSLNPTPGTTYPQCVSSIYEINTHQMPSTSSSLNIPPDLHISSHLPAFDKFESKQSTNLPQQPSTYQSSFFSQKGKKVESYACKHEDLQLPQISQLSQHNDQGIGHHTPSIEEQRWNRSSENVEKEQLLSKIQDQLKVKKPMRSRGQQQTHRAADLSNTLMHAVDTEIMRRILKGEKWDTFISGQHVITASQVQIIKFILANQIAIDHFNSENVAIMEQINPRKELESHLSKERTYIKIKENQIALKKHLDDLPSSDSLVFTSTIKKLNKKVGLSQFSTRYRGVCKNGTKYQMFIMVDGRQKMYIGGIDQASVAGAIYDRAAIQLKGRKVGALYNQAKTNFSYSKIEVIEIMKSKPVFELYDPFTISHLF